MEKSTNAWFASTIEKAVDAQIHQDKRSKDK